MWTHLAGTYDATTGSACLYVNGVQQAGCLTGVQAYDGGALMLGRARWSGNLVEHWQGGLAGIRVYSGIRTATQVQDDLTDDDPGRIFGITH
nr:LamG-like jellyroll fold domain-containing protein [Actinokineospora globicatena]